MSIKQGMLVCLLAVLVLAAILSQMPFCSVEDETAVMKEPISEVHADEPVGEEPRDENLFETDIVVTHGNCVGALYPLRNGDILKLSEDYELTARYVDGTNNMACIEFLENGMVVNDENLTTSTRDTTWDICFFQENE